MALDGEKATTGAGDPGWPSNDPDAAVLTMPIGEAMFTQRSIRRVRPDPIPVEHLRIIASAASKAPSGGNRQLGRLLFVTDREKIAAFGALYRASWWRKRKDDHGWNGPEDVGEVDSSMRSAMRLADEMKDVPAVAFILSLPPKQPESVIPAAQNLMLAARALGIGSVPTTLHPDDYPAFRALFDIPENVELYFVIPLGYPRGRFGPTTRLSTTETTHWNHWDGAVPWA
jgi:nitroreductase